MPSSTYVFSFNTQVWTDVTITVPTLEHDYRTEFENAERLAREAFENVALTFDDAESEIACCSLPSGGTKFY